MLHPTIGASKKLVAPEKKGLSSYEKVQQLYSRLKQWQHGQIIHENDARKYNVKVKLKYTRSPRKKVVPPGYHDVKDLHKGVFRAAQKLQPLGVLESLQTGVCNALQNKGDFMLKLYIITFDFVLRQAEGQSVSDHVLLMKSYLDQLATLNYAFPEKSIKRNKQQIVGASSTPHVMAIQSGRVQKNKPQGKAKGKEKGKGLKNSYPTKPKKPQPYKKERPTKDGKCHHCKEEGHWKRNCPLYLAELMKKKKTRGQNVASTSSGVLFLFLVVNKGFTQCFPDFGLSVSMNNMIYFNAITVNGIYEIDMCDSTLPIVNSIYSVSNKRTKPNLDSSYLWHCRLAHRNKKRIKNLQHDGLLKPMDNEPFDQCVSCISGKMTRKPFSHKTKKVKDVLGLIHIDVCGPLRHVLKKGASYFITFTDDYSRYGYVYLLKHKHEVFKTFKVFKNEVENQLGKTIKAIRSDRGGEYISQEFKDCLKAYGIVQQLTPPYSPHLMVFLRGVIVWGCEAHVKRHTPDKLQQRFVKCIFVGYPKETMGYYFYYPPENKIVVERYADFLETGISYFKRSCGESELDDEDILPPENTSEHPIEEESLAPIVSQEEDVVPVRRSVRTHKAPDRLCLNVEIDPDRLSFNIEVEEHSLGDLYEPANYKAALSDPEFEKWLVAMNEEMQSMNDNKVWETSRLFVAKGFTQTYGVDYEETFSPVADIRAIRNLIAIAAYYDYEI
ncbi:retrotransposon protein, putative, ty1-copia subclass [Tanacetum coccineum]